MEGLKIILDELRGVREDVSEVDKKVSSMEATINGDLGIIKRMKDHEKQTADLVKEIHERLSKIEDYILKQKVYVGFIAGALGLIAGLLPKLVAWFFKL